MENNSDRIGAAYFFAVISGAAVWVVCAAVSGKVEAWDSPLYWSLGVPLLYLLAAVLGYLAPDKPWRWSALAFGAQLVVMLVLSLFVGGGFGLLPLGVIVFAILALPGIGLAWMSAFFRRRFSGVPGSG